MKKINKVLLAAVAVLILSGTIYTGVSVMAEDSVSTQLQTVTESQDQIIMTVEELSDNNFHAINTGTLYGNTDSSKYAIITNKGAQLYFINNPDHKIAHISFSTGSYENNVIYATNQEGKYTLLNLDGTFYSNLNDYYPGVVLQSSNSGKYMINDGQNTLFYDKDGTLLFQMQGTGTILWSKFNEYNNFNGTVGGKTYNGVYDNNLNLIYNSATPQIGSTGRFKSDDGINTTFHDKDGSVLFTMPGTGYITWYDFNGYNVFRGKVGDTTYLGIYDNNLNAVSDISFENCTYLSVNKNYLSVNYSISQEKYTKYYNTYFQEIPMPTPDYTKTTLYKLDNGFNSHGTVTLDNIKFVLGGKNSLTTDGKYLSENALFTIPDNTADICPLIMDNIFSYFANGDGLCLIKNGNLDGSLQFVRLHAKALTSASKNEITDNNGTLTSKVDIVNTSDSTQKVQVKIEDTNSAIPIGAALCAAKLDSTSDTSYTLAKRAVAAITDKFMVFDIDLLQSTSSNIKIQPNGNVKVSLSIPSGYSTTNLKVYRIEADGVKTDMNATIINGEISFETNHFSVYVLSDLTSVPTFKLGDVTMDDSINIFDILEIQRYILGISSISGNALNAADVTGDTNIDIFDILLIQRHILGIELIQ